LYADLYANRQDTGTVTHGVRINDDEGEWLEVLYNGNMTTAPEITDWLWITDSTRYM